MFFIDNLHSCFIVNTKIAHYEVYLREKKVVNFLYYFIKSMKKVFFELLLFLNKKELKLRKNMKEKIITQLLCNFNSISIKPEAHTDNYKFTRTNTNSSQF